MMGARHAQTVMRVWADLPHAPMRLLVHMALTAKDSDPNPRYYGGRTSKAEALGYEAPSVSSDRAVERAMKALRDAGAVEMVGKQGPNHPPTYRIETVRNTPRSPVGVPADADGEHPTVFARTPHGFCTNTPRSPVERGGRGELQEEKTPAFTDLVSTDGAALTETETADDEQPPPTRYRIEISEADLRRYFEHEDGDDPKTAQRIDRLNSCRINYRCSLADDDKRRDAVARAIDIDGRRERWHVLRHVDTTHRHDCPVFEGPRRTA